MWRSSAPYAIYNKKPSHRQEPVHSFTGKCAIRSSIGPGKVQSFSLQLLRLSNVIYKALHHSLACMQFTSNGENYAVKLRRRGEHSRASNPSLGFIMLSVNKRRRKRVSEGRAQKCNNSSVDVCILAELRHLLSKISLRLIQAVGNNYESIFSLSK